MTKRDRMKRLYRVMVDLDMFVLAETREAAEDVAQRHVDEELRNGIAMFHASVLTGKGDLSIPWGGDDDRTCEQIMENGGR